MVGSPIRGQRAAVLDLHAGQSDAAAGNCIRSGDRAAVLDRSAFEHDLAALHGQAGSADHAAVVHHAVERALRLPGGQRHGMGGIDAAAVLDAGFQRGILDAGTDQAVAGQVDGDGVAGREGDGGGDDLPGVLHVVADESDAAQRVDEAFVADAAAAGIGEAVIAGHEVVVADAQGRGKDAADIDLGAAGEQHAVGVAEEDLAVGVELAVDFRGAVADDAVQCNGACIGLDEIDGGGAADVEALPIERGALAGLLDGEDVGCLADAGAAGDDLAAGGQGAGIERPGRSADEGERGGEDLSRKGTCYASHVRFQARRVSHRRSAALAASPGDLGDGHPGAGELVPDQAVDAVHAAPLAVAGGCLTLLTRCNSIAP